MLVSFEYLTSRIILVASMFSQCLPKEVSRKKTSTRSYIQRQREYKILTTNVRYRLLLYTHMRSLCSNNNAESPKSSASDEESSNGEKSLSTQSDTSNNNQFQLINWTVDDDLDPIDESDEKIYEDLCYVTISTSSIPSEVLIKKFILCAIYLL